MPHKVKGLKRPPIVDIFVLAGAAAAAGQRRLYNRGGTGVVRDPGLIPCEVAVTRPWRIAASSPRAPG